MALKMMPADVERIRAAIAPLDTDELREVYRSREFPRSDETRDLDKRYRWDLFKASGVKPWEFYDMGMTDSHIDSALRSIVQPLYGL